MISIKDYIAKQFLNKTYHFKCDCILPLDIIGTVIDYEIIGHDTVLLVSSNNKVIHIGLNTASLTVEEC